MHEHVQKIRVIFENHSDVYKVELRQIMRVLQWFSHNDRRQPMAHHSWKLPPALSVQRAHETLQPVMSSHLLSHSILPVYSSSLTQNMNKMPQMAPERGAWKATTQTLMKNKSPLNPTWEEFQPKIHHLYPAANLLLAFHHSVVFSHTSVCFFFHVHSNNSTVMHE